MLNSQVRPLTCVVGIIASLGWGGAWVAADSVRLTNGDIVQGKVVHLNENHLLLRSENFGEMEIPRDKLALIGLGDQSVSPQPVPETAARPGTSSEAAADELPSMQNPQVRQQIDRLLQETLSGKGIGNIGNMQADLQETSRGLKDLQKDLGPGPGADALDGYIKLFELFGGGASESTAPPTNPE